jgi:23S rRNA (guanosine2251-2'-O)-methyltransferase
MDEHELLQKCQQATSPPLLLVLDEISDPHNLGACLRTADAAGVDAVIFPQRNSAPISATVHKIASGASIRLPLVKTANLARFLGALKKIGLWVYGADGEAEQSIYSVNLTHPSVIVLGAEGRGLRELTKKHCDRLCSLPMLGEVESLNVSVATGVFLYEALRQRNV